MSTTKADQWLFNRRDLTCEMHQSAPFFRLNSIRTIRSQAPSSKYQTKSHKIMVDTESKTDTYAAPGIPLEKPWGALDYIIFH